MERLSFTMKGLLEYVYEADQYASRIFLGNISNLPRRQAYYPKIFYKNGEWDSYNGIEHLLYALYQHGQTGVKVDIDKTTNALKKDLGEDFKRTVVMEVLKKDVVKKENNEKDVDNEPEDGSIGDSSLKDVKSQPDLPTIKSAATEMKAAEFKEWLKEYLLTFETFNYKVESVKGVKKLITEIEETVNG